jgi:hypothetical protein
MGGRGRPARPAERAGLRRKLLGDKRASWAASQVGPEREREEEGLKEEVFLFYSRTTQTNSKKTFF